MAKNLDGPYKPPKWSNSPDHKFKLNVYKNGQFLESIPIFEKEYYIIGRGTKNVDIKLLHPSLSRHHLVLQHKSGPFCYLFDLNSANKTWLNKKALKPFEFTKFCVGDFIQLAFSTRYFYLDGPKNLMPELNGMALDYAPDKSKHKISKIKDKHLVSGKSVNAFSWGLNEDGLSEEDRLTSLYEKQENIENSLTDNKQKKEKMEQIKNKIDNEIAKNEKIELKRRKRIKEMIDVEENDIFIDRTNKKIKSVEKEETEILIEETNLKLKLEKLEEKLNSNKVVENDSLDSFMADINNESLKRQIAAIHKRLKQIRNSLK